MFSEFFDSDYQLKRFLLKGNIDKIEEIVNNPEYDVEVLNEERDEAMWTSVIEVSQYTETETIILENPEIAAVGFVEEWGEEKDVHVAISLEGSTEIDNCIRVGYFDGHNDYNWHDKCPIIAEGYEVQMGYSGEYETAYYTFPFFSQWG